MLDSDAHMPSTVLSDASTQNPPGGACLVEMGEFCSVQGRFLKRLKLNKHRRKPVSPNMRWDFVFSTNCMDRELILQPKVT